MITVTRAALEVDEEQAIAHAIMGLEVEITEVLAPIPECVAILGRPGRKIGRTRSAAVDRLESAVQALARVQGHTRAVATARAKWHEAEQLRWRLALSATRVAYREARRLANNPTLAQADLVQEGFIGLLAAAKRYEPNRETRFATYARWWVRAQMTRAIDLARVVRLSAGACEQLRNLRKQIRIYEMAGVTWTVAEAAADAGIETERARCLLAQGATQSMDEPEEDSGHSDLQLADETAAPLDELCANRQEVERLHAALSTALPDRLRKVIARRYGIGQEPRTLAEIARGMSLSRERVRQLEHQSIGILREVCNREQEEVAHA